MKIIFAGTPHFAVPSLAALVEANHTICLVLTQPDRPVGRGQKQQASPVKHYALSQHLPVFQPQSLKNSDAQQLLKDQDADLMVVAAYGLLLPEAVLTIPKQGCINIHASLLPRFRGAAPIPYSLLEGDTETGITLMQMDKGLDTGDMIARASVSILANDTTQTLHDKLATLGASLLTQTLPLLATLPREKQNNAQATHAGKITKEQALLDWHNAASYLGRQVRAFNPWPISYFKLDDQFIRVFEANILSKDHTKEAGTIIEANADHLYIACQSGIFSPTVMQFPGKNPLSWKEIYHARKHLFPVGKVL